MSGGIKKKKILVISNMYPSKKDPYYGTFVKVFYEALEKKTSWPLSLITIKGKKKGIIQKLISYIILYFRIFFVLLIRNFDLIYVHTISHPTPPIRFVSWLKKLKVIYNIHGEDLLASNKISAKLLSFSQPLLKSALAIVVPTEYYKNVLMELYPVLKSKRIIISPSGGISQTFYTYKLKSSINEIKLGFVSRIDEGKGWDIFLRGLYLLKREGISFKGLMYGRGAQENELLKLIGEYDLEKEVIYYGPQSHEELANIYPNFDLFVFPTLRKAESLGLVGLEAMASCVPVVGSNIGGLPSYIKDGENGYLFSPGDEMGLAVKIKAFYNLNCKDRMIMQDNAYRTAIEYRSQKVNEELIAQLKELI